MPKPAEFHLIIQQLPDGEYALLDGMPSEHKLKSNGAHRYDLELGRLTLWLVNCNLNPAQAQTIAADAIAALE
jgi:hypothetical protein